MSRQSFLILYILQSDNKFRKAIRHLKPPHKMAQEMEILQYVKEKYGASC